jgi:DNA repair photolyase
VKGKRPLAFEEYEADRIVNTHKHVDPWFWTKYSAHPHMGCRSGCAFCYSRSSRYLGSHKPEDFDTLIRVKANAVELLRKELRSLDQEVISCGDWQQPVENRYRLSRSMLKVVRDLGFPLFIVERSPLLSRDLDLLKEINERAWVAVAFSISSLDQKLKRAFEPYSPGVPARLQTMEELATAGLTVGTALMPIIPFVGDDEAHLEDVVRATKEHGGSFVLGGGLTMDGVQAERSLAAARGIDPQLESQWRHLYGWQNGGKPNYSPPSTYTASLGLLIRALCARHDLRDRLPRYIPPGPLGVNKRIAERLFLKTYELELEQAKGYRIWAYRKAAWAVDEHPESVADIYTAQGEAGLRELDGIGKSIGGHIAAWLQEMGAAHSPQPR